MGPSGYESGSPASRSASAHPAWWPRPVLSQPWSLLSDEGTGLANLKAPSRASPSAHPVLIDTAKPGKLHTIPIPVARCYTYNWNQDSFGKQLARAPEMPTPKLPGPSCWSRCLSRRAAALHPASPPA